MESGIFVILKPVDTESVGLSSVDDMFYTYNGYVRSWDTEDEAEQWREDQYVEGKVIKLTQSYS